MRNLNSEFVLSLFAALVLLLAPLTTHTLSGAVTSNFCNPTCGDGICQAECDEVCPQDCEVACNDDGVCDQGESAEICPLDCVSVCNDDGVCNQGETEDNCQQDCGNDLAPEQNLSVDDEQTNAASPQVPVTDGPDADKDGITDSVDNCPASKNTDQSNLDKDKLGDACDEDRDGDKMMDGWERQNGLNYNVNDAVLDPDNDGYSNLEEFNRGSDPHVVDSRNLFTKALDWVETQTKSISNIDYAAILSDPFVISMIAVVVIMGGGMGFLVLRMMRPPKKFTQPAVVPSLLSHQKRGNPRRFMQEQNVRIMRREQKLEDRESAFLPFDERRKQQSPILKELENISGFGTDQERNRAVDSLADLAENEMRNAPKK